MDAKIKEQELQEMLSRVFAHDSALYQNRGFQRRIGFGKKPALINIDLANAWTQPGNPFTCAGMETIIPAVQALNLCHHLQRRDLPGAMQRRRGAVRGACGAGFGCGDLQIHQCQRGRMHRLGRRQRLWPVRERPVGPLTTLHRGSP